MSIKDIAAKGRYGDTHLLHVSDAEVQGLNALAHKHYGHGLTTNPDTGLPEAFLFTPFLAPLIAGAGSSMLGTAAIAGGLGAAEAAARGMDDPLGQGLMAGLTAGAGSALGSSLGQIGSDAAAQTAIEGANQAAMDEAMKLSMNEAVKNQATNTLQNQLMNAPLNPLENTLAEGVSNASLMGDPSFGLGNEMAVSNLPNTTFSTQAGNLTGGGLEFGVDGTLNAIPEATPTFEFNPSGQLAPSPTPVAPVENVVFNQGVGQEPGLFEGLMEKNYPNFGQPGDIMGRAKNIGRGISEVGSSGEAFGNFLSDNQGALASGMIGIGGQAQLDQAQQMREDSESRQAQLKSESDAKRKAVQDQIRANYAAVGRAMPTGPYGGPLFKEGGDVSYDGKGKYLPDWVREHAMEQQKKKVDKKAEGGLASLNFNKARGYAAGGYTTNIYGDKIPYDNTITSGESSNRFGSIFEDLFSQMFAKAGITPDAAGQQNAYSDKHNALVGKLQTGMGNQQALSELKDEGYAMGGYLETGGRVGDGMSDDIPATIDGTQPAALSDGEFVIPADVVSHLGNGSSDAGAQQLYAMMDRIRQARTGTKEQGKEINAKKMLPS